MNMGELLYLSSKKKKKELNVRVYKPALIYIKL